MSCIQPFAKALASTVLMLPLACAVACSSIAIDTSTSFDAVKVGDTENRVVQTLGPPTLRERGMAGALQALPPCTGACAIRLWYENPCSSLDQAWSFEFDRHGAVTRKTIWSIPALKNAAEPAKLAGTAGASMPISSESEPVNDF